MAIILKDRVKVTTGVTGTGTVTLGAAVVGFQSFAIIGDGNQTYYTIAAQSDADFEVGIGTVTDTDGTFTLSRDTVLESSNAGSLVDFPAGTKDVFVTYPAERAVFLNSAGTSVAQLAFGAITATSVAMTTGTVSTAPAGTTDIANKAYVDEVAEGLATKPAVEMATTENLSATYDNGAAGVGATLTGTVNGALPTIDGITLTSTVIGFNGVLIKNQTAKAHNGRYNLTTVGDASNPFVLTRCGLCDEASEIPGAFVFVKAGTINGGSGFVQVVANPATFVVGVDDINVFQFSGAGTFTAGTGLTLDGSEFSITNVGTAGTFGSASQVPVFVTNAQGQVTAVTNTGIAISSAAVSGLAASATTDTTNATNITSGTLGTARLSGSYTGITGVGTLTAGTWSASTILANRGGTGFASYAVGDLLYADTTTTLDKLPGVAVGNALISGGVGSVPTYGKIGLATHVSGTLPVASGGTGVTSSTGTGSVVLSSSPTLVTPALGTPSSGNLANCTFPTLNQSTTGNAATATALQNARTIGGVSFNGTANINLPGVNTAGNQNTTGSAATLTTARTIGGVSFNGSANINLPGVNIAGNQNTTGNAATATALQTARTINNTSFNGSANITTNLWGAGRTITIGNSGKSVNGSVNATWTNQEISNITPAPADSYAGFGNGVQLADTTYPAGTGSVIASFIFSSNRGIQLATSSFSENTPLQFRRVHTQHTNGLGAFQKLVDEESTQSITGTKTFASSILSNVGIGSFVNALRDPIVGATNSVGTAAQTLARGRVADGYFGLSVNNNQMMLNFISTANFDATVNSTTICFRTNTAGDVIAAGASTAQRFVSTVATGTAPITVTSTTRVNNLNVDRALRADRFTTARTLTIGSTGKAFNGSANVSWTLAEIGAAPAESAIPAGTKMMFVQTAAPTGWTKDTTHNNKALRVVSGTASTGGTVAFTTAFASKAVSGTVGNTTLTESQIPSHNHSQVGVNNLTGSGLTSGSGVSSGATANTGNRGGSSAHNHSFTGTAINMAVQYVDVIIATKA